MESKHLFGADNLNYIVRYRLSKDGELIFRGETDDEATARDWANRLWSNPQVYEVILYEETTVMKARKVRK